MEDKYANKKKVEQEENGQPPQEARNTEKRKPRKVRGVTK